MTWETVAELALRWAVPAALSAIAGAIGGAIVSAFARRKTKKEQEAAQNTAQNIHIATGVQCLLRAEIIRSALSLSLLLRASVSARRTSA